MKNEILPNDSNEKVLIGVNQAIRELGVSKGQSLYLKSKYPKGTRYTIDKWKRIIKK